MNDKGIKGLLRALAPYLVKAIPAAPAYELIPEVRMWLQPNPAYLTITKTQPDPPLSEALQKLCRLADTSGVALRVTVRPSVDGLVDEVDAQGLVDWYSRFGFDGDADEMIREPN